MGERSRPPQWVHFIGGGLGGVAGAVVTSPLEVVKTRMQSSAAVRAAGQGTMSAIRRIVALEGARALFRGLAPTIYGVAPSRAIYFSSYSTVKDTLSERYPSGGSWVHMGSAVAAGWFTATVTNPIWVVKTRLQLQTVPVRSTVGAAVAAADTLTAGTASGLAAAGRLPYRGTLDCFVRIAQEEGVRALYRGLSASYVGAAEGTLNFVVYERLKKMFADRFGYDPSPLHCFVMASGSKLFASVTTYPHEVVRTRLREAQSDLKYNGFFDCLRKVYRAEGVRGLYGGLAPHLIKTVPNAAVMFAVYELVVLAHSWLRHTPLPRAPPIEEDPASTEAPTSG